MTDTYKTLSQLLTTMFQDGQSVGAITPQDMRDLIISAAQVPYGGMHTLTSLETTINTASVYEKGNCTSQISNLRNFDMPDNNRLRYIGTIPYHMHIACSISMKTAGNGKLASFKLFHFDDSVGSGAVIDGSQVNRFVSVGADEGSTALHWDVVLDTNDYLELHVANLTDNTNITISNFYMFAVGMLV